MARYGSKEVVRLDTPSIPTAERFDAWREFYTAQFDIEPTDETRNFTEWAYSRHHLDKIVFINAFEGPYSSVRNVKNTKNEWREHLLLNINTCQTPKDSLVLTRSGEEFVERGPQSVSIMDFGSTWQTKLRGPNQSYIILVPYSALTYDPSLQTQHAELPANCPSAIVLRCAIFSIFEQLPRIEESEAYSIASGFSGLLRGLLNPHLADEEARASIKNAVLCSIKEHIEARISDLSLGPAHICRSFGVSRPVLYRLFKESGGVAAYITERRLEHAFKDLTTHAPERGAITRAAERYGYPDVQQFSRSFRRRYGVSPTVAQELGEMARLT